MKNDLIYGSTAIKHFFPDFSREPNDLDYISYVPEILFNKGTHHSEHIHENKVEMYYLKSFEYILDNNIDDRFVDPNFLYTIKVSHAAWDVKWEKTIKDISFLKSKGCTLDKELFNSLYKEWEIIHSKKKVKMGVKNEEFFKENIERKYDHDFLHYHFKYYHYPLNHYIREDLSKPLCSEKLWNELDHFNKIRTALEEIFILATERYILNGMPPKGARIKTLKQMITSSTSGWFNLFLILNFDELRTTDEEYFNKKLKELN